MPTHRAPLFVIAALLLALPLAGCGEDKTSKAAAAPPPPPQVTVSKPTKRVISEHDEYVGRVVAVDYVEVRSRVSGYLQTIDFTDGQIVKKGERLFTIDPRPFQAQSIRRRAPWRRRRLILRMRKRICGAERFGARFDYHAANIRSADTGKARGRGAVIAQEAAQRQSELDLQFTQLTSPVTGRIGDRRVSVGNLVTGGTSGGTTLLATIATVDPIRFEFTMDEASYLRYLRAAGGENVVIGPNRGMRLPAKLKLIDEKDFTHEGRIDFVDNAIDTSSGTSAAVPSSPTRRVASRLACSVEFKSLLRRPPRPSSCRTPLWNRAGSQVRLRSQRRQCRQSEIRDARPCGGWAARCAIGSQS